MGSWHTFKVYMVFVVSPIPSKPYAWKSVEKIGCSGTKKWRPFGIPPRRAGEGLEIQDRA
jgi:hypothetical protein